MTPKLHWMIAGIALTLAAAVQAQQTLPRTMDAAPRAEEQKLDTDYKAEREKCNGLKDNAKDVCIAEAKGKYLVARAEIDARKQRNPALAAFDVARTKADAEYRVAKERCDDQTGDAKSTCRADAKAAYDQAVQQARDGLKANQAAKSPG